MSRDAQPEPHDQLIADALDLIPHISDSDPMVPALRDWCRRANAAVTAPPRPAPLPELTEGETRAMEDEYSAAWYAMLVARDLCTDPTDGGTTERAYAHIKARERYDAAVIARASAQRVREPERGEAVNIPVGENGWVCITPALAREIHRLATEGR